MSIEFKCKNCANEITIPDELAGHQLECDQCKIGFIVPAPEGDYDTIALEEISPNIHILIRFNYFAAAIYFVLGIQSLYETIFTDRAKILEMIKMQSELFRKFKLGGSLPPDDVMLSTFYAFSAFNICIIFISAVSLIYTAFWLKRNGTGSKIPVYIGIVAIFISVINCCPLIYAVPVAIANIITIIKIKNR